MNNTITISEAVPEDASGIVDVRRSTWLSTYPNEKAGITREDIQAAINQRTRDEEIARRKERLRNDTSTKIWVAKKDDQVIGFLLAERKAEKNRIGALYILSSYQNQGIGTELMNRALKWLGTEKDIHFEVAAYNAQAIAFYKKFGFIENGPGNNPVGNLPTGKSLPEVEILKIANS